MSSLDALDRLATLRDQERELLALRCARCHHGLGRHIPYRCAGDIGREGCSCPGWRDPKNEARAL